MPQINIFGDDAKLRLILSIVLNQYSGRRTQHLFISVDLNRNK